MFNPFTVFFSCHWGRIFVLYYIRLSTYLKAFNYLFCVLLLRRNLIGFISMSGTHILTQQLTHEFLCDQNGEDYSPSDIRTYCDEPLAFSPSDEIYFRRTLEAESKAKMSSGGGSVFQTTKGNVLISPTLINRDSCSNMVCKFPTTKDFEQGNIVKIKSIKLKTILPKRLVERYRFNRNIPNVTHAQSVPVFYNSKSEKFFVTLDVDFLSDFSYTDLEEGIKEFGLRNYNGKKNTSFLAIEADTLSDLKNKTDCFANLIDGFAKFYQQLFIDYQRAERIIVAMFDAKTNERDGYIPDKLDNFKSPHSLASYLHSSKADFCFYQAAKVNNKAYLIDSEGKISHKCVLYIAPEETVSKLDKDFEAPKGLEGFKFHSDRLSAYLIMPFTQQDWDILLDLDARLKKLYLEIEQVLFKAVTPHTEMDRGLTTLASGIKGLPIK